MKKKKKSSTKKISEILFKMNGHKTLDDNGNSTELNISNISQTIIEDIASTTSTSNVEISSTTITAATTTKHGFRLNGNRYAEHEEFSTGK